MTRPRAKRRRLAQAFASALTVVPSCALGATVDWINPSGGTFQDGPNWAGGAVPGSGDTARFGIAGIPIAVDFIAGTTNDRMIVASGADVRFNAHSFNLVLNNFASNGVVVGDVASPEPARLNLASGRIGSFDVALGEQVGSAGIGTIGAASSWSVSRAFRIGAAGAGTLTATPGAFHNSPQLVLGDTPTGSGFLQLDSAFAGINGFMRIGRFGTGTLLVTGETSMGLGTTIIGDEPDSHGVVHIVHNSEWTGGALIVGNAGEGALVMDDGTMVVASAAGSSVARLAGSSGRVEIRGGAVASVGPMYVGGDAGAPGGAATVTLNGGTLFVSPTMRVWGGGRVEWNDGSLSSGQVELKQTARMTLAAGPAHKVLQVTRLSVEGASGARLDVNDNAMIVNYASTGPSPINELRDRIAQGFAGGSWTGDGITSTVAAQSAFADALGFGEAAALGITQFFGTPVDATTVVLRYTRAGDANLDGIVNLTDFNALAAHFGATTSLWTDGDFNYDGRVNLDDFNLLAANFGASASLNPAGTPLPEPIAGLALTPLIFVLRARRTR